MNPLPARITEQAEPDRAAKPGGFRLPAWAVQTGILLALWGFYLAIFLHYRPYEIDNPWFLSFSYNLCAEHVTTDQFMNVLFPAGMGGTQLFGKLAAYSQCGVARVLGWNQPAALLLSSTLVVFGLAMWVWQLRRLGSSPRFIACFLVASGLLEPALGTANRFRYEPVAFALIALGLACMASRRPFIGAFLAGLAVEVEPAAAAGVISVVILAWFLVRNDPSAVRRSFFLRATAGLFLALVLYFSLHPDSVHIGSYLHQAQEPVPFFNGGVIRSYFLQRPRHLPELICFLVATFLYLRRRRSFSSHYFGVSALALVLFAFLLPHGNQAYMIFVYPSLVAMALTAFRAERRTAATIAAVLLWILPQLLYLAWLTRGLGFRNRDIDQIAQAIRTAAQNEHIPDSTLRIFGDYRLYFAHPHLYHAAYISMVPQVHAADLYLCYETPPQPPALEPPFILYCSTIRELTPVRPVGAVDIRGSRIILYVPR